MSTITDYLEQYALTALEKQDKLALMIGEHSCSLDLEAGKIRINEAIEFPIQVLGTESDNTLSWLWAWADEQTEVPLELLSASLQAKKWGEQKGIPEFNVPSVDLNRADGHALAMIATEICQASCYYRDAYEGGAAYVLLFDKRIDVQSSFDLSRLLRRYQDLLSRYELNHRNALVSYLHAKGLSPAEKGDMISMVLKTGESLSAEFDHSGRLLSLNGKAIKY
jgi:hypothetical protein